MISTSGIREKESKILSKLESPWLLHVLLYELLIGRDKTLKGKTVFEKCLLQRKTFLAAEWARLKVKKKAKSDADMAIKPERNGAASNGVASITGTEGEARDRNAPTALPRYVRVNTLKATMNEVVAAYVERVMYSYGIK